VHGSDFFAAAARPFKRHFGNAPALFGGDFADGDGDVIEGAVPLATVGKRGVVLATLKRHAVNAHSCSPAKEKVFRQVDDERFEML
jgi:hypothetical protein